MTNTPLSEREKERNAAFGYLVALHIKRTLEKIRPELSWNRNSVPLETITSKAPTE